VTLEIEWGEATLCLPSQVTRSAPPGETVSAAPGLPTEYYIAVEFAAVPAASERGLQAMLRGTLKEQ
jgi:hypothetical protein